MPSLKLLPGEREEARLRPHPLSWMSQYFIAAYPLIVGVFLFILYTSDSWQTDRGNWFLDALFGNIAMGYLYPLVLLALMGAIIAVSAIRWKVFFGYMAIGILAVAGGGAISSGWMNEADQYVWAIPTLLMVLSLPVIAGTEWHRRSHKYTLTNYRIIFRGGVFNRHERQLKYESITDLDGQQGILGRILNFGTLIPITQSGFGLGADNSMAMMGVGMGADKGGMGAGIGVAAGGGKEVNVARARTYHQLTGVRPYKKVKFTLETLIQNATSTPYLQQQVELQRQMLGAMQHMAQPQQPHGYPPMPPAPQPMPPQPYPPQQQAAQYPHPSQPPAYAPDPYAQMASQTPPMGSGPGQTTFGGQRPLPSGKPEKRGLFGRKKQQAPSEWEYEFREAAPQDPVFEGRRLR